jgi:hypothetical protein
MPNGGTQNCPKNLRLSKNKNIKIIILTEHFLADFGLKMAKNDVFDLIISPLHTFAFWASRNPGNLFTVYNLDLCF